MGNGYFHNERQRGFTLMEIAIVLAVVGIILATIWGTATAVRERANVNQAGEELGLIATSIQSLYSSRNVTFTALGSPGAFVDMTATYAGQNVFPTEMVSGTAVSDPWGGPVLAGLSGTNATTPVKFFIEYQNVPTDGCAALVATNSMPGRPTGLMQINITDSSGDPPFQYSSAAGKLPISPATLADICTVANAPFTIDWYYKLGQGCTAGSTC